MSNSPHPEDDRYARRFQILFALMAAIIMAPLDGSMVNVIFSTLTEVFSAEIATAQWVPMIYLPIISSLLLLFGRLGDICKTRAEGSPSPGTAWVPALMQRAPDTTDDLSARPEGGLLSRLFSHFGVLSMPANKYEEFVSTV